MTQKVSQRRVPLWAVHTLIVSIGLLAIYVSQSLTVHFGNIFFADPASPEGWRAYKAFSAANAVTPVVVLLLGIGYTLAATFAITNPHLPQQERITAKFFLVIGAIILNFVVASIAILYFMPGDREQTLRALQEGRVGGRERGWILVVGGFWNVAFIAFSLWNLSRVLSLLSLPLQALGALAAVLVLSAAYAFITYRYYIPSDGAYDAWLTSPLLPERANDAFLAWASEHSAGRTQFAQPDNFVGLGPGDKYSQMFAYYIDTAVQIALLDIPRLCGVNLSSAELGRFNPLLSLLVFSYRVFVTYLFVPLAFRFLKPVLPRLVH